MNENIVILLAIILAFGAFYVSQNLTGSTGIAVGVGLLVGVVLPVAVNQLQE